MPASPASDRDVFPIEVVSDVVCPWCFIGKRRLEKAIVTHPMVEGFVLSAAVGAAACPPAPSLADALRKADERLYARKQLSRRVVGLR